MKSIAKDLWLHRIAGTSIKDKSLLASLAFTSENDAYAFQFSQLARFVIVMIIIFKRRLLLNRCMLSDAHGRYKVHIT